MSRWFVTGDQAAEGQLRGITHMISYRRLTRLGPKSRTTDPLRGTLHPSESGWRCNSTQRKGKNEPVVIFGFRGMRPEPAEPAPERKSESVGHAKQTH